MHGNVAEWTLSAYRPYPYDPSNGRNSPDSLAERVVRGGSYLDRPDLCRAGAQLVEFDKQGDIVWSWHDPDRAGSILAVVILDQLDTTYLLQEKGEILVEEK